MRYQLSSIFVLVVTILMASNQAEASCGKFVVVKGDVKIESSKTKQVTPAQMNAEACSGDSISAGADARAKVVMVDGNEINLSPDTKMIIENYDYSPEQGKKKVMLNVLFGKVRANVKQKYDEPGQTGADNSFQVKTKTAVAGVRGTDFLTSFAASTGKSEVVTFSGKVMVGQPGPGGMTNAVPVAAGQKTVASPNQPPSPAVKVPAGELKQLNSATSAGPAGNSSNNAPAAGGSKSANAKSSDSGSGSSSNSSSGSGSSSGSSSSSASGSSGGSASGGAANATSGSGSTSGGSIGASTAASGPAPASIAPSAGSMLNTVTDTGPNVGINTDAGGAISGPAGIPAFVAPPPPIVSPVIPVCTACQAATQGGPAKVSITIIRGN